ncbi:MAG: SAM-dependent methyltransferase [Woeseiaceae bacterium]|jgi:SAM-dependent MidA family methyltransferase|nr:SAM-dependent methyltransferase [Woeseiaceae bacterium]
MQPKISASLKLPSPDSDSAAHSAKVFDCVADAIDAGGRSISFAEFMHLALYAPGLGYYSAGSRKFGTAGDFVTAPEISPLFGNVLAGQSAYVLDQLGGGDILEPGAGTGALAVSMLRKLDELSSLPENYFILEVSPDLAERQAARIKVDAPEFFDRVSWLAEIPKTFAGVVIANEVIDAFPVERFLIREGNVLQSRVTMEGGNLTWTYAEAPSGLATAVRNIECELGCTFPDGYTSEISFAARNWVSELAASITAGFVFLIDYGVTRREYYAAERSDGWLRCHFRHHAHDNPLLLPGIQDVTTWVDFTSVAEAAVAADMSVAGYVTQASFLLNGGLEGELANFDSLSISEQVELSGRIKLLTLPAEMGEHFKCMGLSRGALHAPSGLTAFDRTHLL